MIIGVGCWIAMGYIPQSEPMIFYFLVSNLFFGWSIFGIGRLTFWFLGVSVPILSGACSTNAYALSDYVSCWVAGTGNVQTMQKKKKKNLLQHLPHNVTSLYFYSELFNLLAQS